MSLTQFPTPYSEYSGGIVAMVGLMDKKAPLPLPRFCIESSLIKREFDLQVF